MILVVGATGMLGGMITARLLAEGPPVRVLVRPQSEYAPLEAAGATVAFGDLKERDSLDAAMQGVEYVVTTANSARRGGADTVDTVEIEGNRNLIDAARRARVKQFVFVSALGASLDQPSAFLRGKAMTEEYLRASLVPYTILAPNLFMEVWITSIVAAPLEADQPVTLIGEGRRKHSFVSAEDVAAFAVAALGNPAALNQYIPLGGPMAVSWTEIVDSCGRALGRSIAVRHIAAGEPVPGFPAVVAELMSAFETFDSPIEMEATARTFGVTLTPVETFAQRTFGGSRA